MGGCNSIFPARVFARERRPAANSTQPSGQREVRLNPSSFFLHTIGEMEQAIACFRGERTIPADLYGCCGLSKAIAPSPRTDPLTRADLVLVEPTTWVEITLDGYCLNRVWVVRVLELLKSLGPDATALHKAWFLRFINVHDQEGCLAAGRALAPLIPEELPGRALLVRLVTDARSSRRDMREGLANLCDRLERPLGVVACTWAYMADGRPISWPAGFHDEIVRAARDLGLPLFEPRTLLEKTDLRVSLDKDLRHYSEAFMPVIGDALAEFALELAAGSAGARAAVAGA